jgi:hypothetical protein
MKIFALLYAGSPHKFTVCIHMLASDLMTTVGIAAKPYVCVYFISARDEQITPIHSTSTRAPRKAFFEMALSTLDYEMRSEC